MDEWFYLSVFSSWLVRKINKQLPAMCIVPPLPLHELVFLLFQLIFLGYYWQSELSKSVDDRPKPNSPKCESLEAQLIVLSLFRFQSIICNSDRRKYFLPIGKQAFFCCTWQRRELFIWITPVIVFICCVKTKDLYESWLSLQDKCLMVEEPSIHFSCSASHWLILSSIWGRGKGCVRTS